MHVAALPEVGGLRVLVELDFRAEDSGDKGLGRSGQVDVGSEEPGFLPLSDEVAMEAPEPSEHLLKLSGECGVGVDGFDHEGQDEPAVIVRDCVLGAQARDGAKPLGRPTLAFDLLEHEFLEGLDSLGHGLEEQLLLVFPVVVERAFGHPGGSGDPIDGGTGVAVAGKAVDRGEQNAPSPGLCSAGSAMFGSCNTKRLVCVSEGVNGVQIA